MRIDYIIAVLMVACSVSMAEWGSGDSQILTDIRNNQYDSIDYDFQFANGYTFSGTAGRYFGWKDFYKNMYLKQMELTEGEEYKYRRVDGNETTTLVSQNMFTERNLSSFDLSQYAGDNTSFYFNSILQYYPSNYSINVDNNVPDSGFVSYPEYGDQINKMVAKMNNEGFGISDIENSSQTEGLRTEISNVETKMHGMISNDYSSSYLNYDFSEIGNFFVRSGAMVSNPFLNLRGTLKIKPDVGDMHYNIWHMYFDRSSSTYAIVLKYCIHTIMFLWFTVYVINDLMSIVDA